VWRLGVIRLQDSLFNPGPQKCYSKSALRPWNGWSNGFLIQEGVFACVFTSLRNIAGARCVRHSAFAMRSAQLRRFAAKNLQGVENGPERFTRFLAVLSRSANHLSKKARLPTLSVVPCHLNSTGMLTFETVPGLNFHVRTVLRTDLSSSGLPVLCAIEALVTLPLAGSTDTTQTPLPAMRCERASCGYWGRGA
jgi:hypothetical protein